MRTRKIFAAGAVVSLVVGLCGLTGCNTIKGANVQLDSSKTVKPKTPEQIQAIKDNPHIPTAIKAQMLGQAGGPPGGHK